MCACVFHTKRNSPQTYSQRAVCGESFIVGVCPLQRQWVRHAISQGRVNAISGRADRIRARADMIRMWADRLIVFPNAIRKTTPTAAAFSRLLQNKLQKGCRSFIEVVNAWLPFCETGWNTSVKFQKSFISETFSELLHTINGLCQLWKGIECGAFFAGSCCFFMNVIP